MQRTHLPIPAEPRQGLITFDAKDPDTSYPPIRPVLPPASAASIWGWWRT